MSARQQVPNHICNLQMWSNCSRPREKKSTLVSLRRSLNNDITDINHPLPTPNIKTKLPFRRTSGVYKNVLPNLKWSIMKRVKSYSNTSKICRLCLQEKLEILRNENKSELLNKRSEIVSKCRNMNQKTDGPLRIFLLFYYIFIIIYLLLQFISPIFITFYDCTIFFKM